MTRYEIALKRSEQFDLIGDYCLQMIKTFCKQYGLEIVYTGSAYEIDGGRIGIFSLTRAGRYSRHIEVSFWYKALPNGEIIWNPSCPLIKSY